MEVVWGIVDIVGWGAGRGTWATWGWGTVYEEVAYCVLTVDVAGLLTIIFFLLGTYTFWIFGTTTFLIFGTFTMTFGLWTGAGVGTVTGIWAGACWIWTGGV